MTNKFDAELLAKKTVERLERINLDLVESSTISASVTGTEIVYCEPNVDIVKQALTQALKAGQENMQKRSVLAVRRWVGLADVEQAIRNIPIEGEK